MDSIISSVDPETGKTTPLYKLKREPQCKAKHWVGHQCQGVRGHEGDHWCFNLSGGLEQWGKWGSSMTPPGHKSYVSPVKMYELRPKVTQIPIKRGRGRTVPKAELTILKRRMKASKKAFKNRKAR